VTWLTVSNADLKSKSIRAATWPWLITQTMSLWTTTLLSTQWNETDGKQIVI